MSKRSLFTLLHWLAFFTFVLGLFTLNAGHIVYAQSAMIYKDLHDFDGSYIPTDGIGPESSVTFDSKGNMYGTTQQGGAAPTNYLVSGIVWELTASGAFIDLHDFGGTTTNAGGGSGPDGYAPRYNVTFDANGNMYGTASNGGANGGGTSDEDLYNGAGMVWEITASGQYKDLHDFEGTVTNADGVSGLDGASPSSGVVFDSAGNMYGVTSAGGANGGQIAGGMVWEITASGTYKDLHDFGGTVTNASGSSGPDGIGPTGNIAFDANGNIYGVAVNGGPHGGAFTGGIIWEITSSGVYKDIHDFGGTTTNADGATGPDGNLPASGVTLDKAGDMYGTAQYGGANPTTDPTQNAGMVWEITAGGTYEDLHDFGGAVVTNADGTTGSDGIQPRCAIAFDTAGNIYGTTTEGGPHDNGNAWKLTLSGVYVDLHDFGVLITDTHGNLIPDGGGVGPDAGVTLDAAGNIYGTVTSGGFGDGMVWKLAGFQPGLQMFSLPFSYPTTDLDALFGYSGATLAVWSPATSTYALTPTAPADQIRVGQGYWVRFPQEEMITGAGTPADQTQSFDIPLTAGWNMIGDPFDIPVPLDTMLFNNGTENFAQATSSTNPLVGTTLYFYPAGATQYQTATTLHPEQGYWIFAFKNTDMQVSPTFVP